MRYLVRSQAGPVLFLRSNLETSSDNSRKYQRNVLHIYEGLQIIYLRGPPSRKIGKAQRRFTSLRTNRVKPVVIAQRQHLFRYLV